MTVAVKPDGSLAFVHRDDLQQALAGEGRIHIRRASAVEPDDDGNWWADLAPLGGPKLGPFATRARALEREVEWLEQRLERGGL